MSSSSTPASQPAGDVPDGAVRGDAGVLESVCCGASLPVERRGGIVMAVCDECGDALFPAIEILSSP